MSEWGREWHSHLAPRLLGEIYRAWLSGFALHAEESLERLKRQVEEAQNMTATRPSPDR